MTSKGDEAQTQTEPPNEMSIAAPTLDLTVIAPAHNERENVAELAEQIHAALTSAEAPAGLRWEFILVDDGSTDGTGTAAIDLARERGWPWLRVVSMRGTPPNSGNGQSAAFHAGFRAARGALVATLDADLQNDPMDIPRLMSEMERTGADFVQGDRSAARREGDHAVRQFGSLVGRSFRRWLLGDSIRDTGCSLRVMRREITLRLPLEYKGMHRFIPVTARNLGYTVVEKPVAHRARHAGEPKYGMGIMTRALPGLVDCLAVRWMTNRRRPVTAEDTTPDGMGTGAEPADTATRATAAATAEHQPAGAGIP